MSTKQVRVSTISPQVFMEEVLKLGKLGAQFGSRGIFMKTPMLTCIVDVPENAEVQEGPVVKVMTTSVNKSPEVQKEYTKEDMSSMSLKEVRDIVSPLGITGRDKLVMIDEYLEKTGKTDQKEETEDKPE